MIKAGDLDERITLFSPDAAVDDGFTTIPGGWSSQGTVFAQYMPGTVKEVFENAGREGKMPAVFLVRRTAVTESIDETWKVVHRFSPYDVQGAVRSGRDGIRITCVSGDMVVT